MEGKGRCWLLGLAGWRAASRRRGDEVSSDIEQLANKDANDDVLGDNNDDDIKEEEDDADADDDAAAADDDDDDEDDDEEKEEEDEEGDVVAAGEEVGDLDINASGSDFEEEKFIAADQAAVDVLGKDDKDEAKLSEESG